MAEDCATYQGPEVEVESRWIWPWLNIDEMLQFELISMLRYWLDFELWKSGYQI